MRAPQFISSASVPRPPSVRGGSSRPPGVLATLCGSSSVSTQICFRGSRSWHVLAVLAWHAGTAGTAGTAGPAASSAQVCLFAAFQRVHGASACHTRFRTCGQTRGRQ